MDAARPLPISQLVRLNRTARTGNLAAAAATARHGAHGLPTDWTAVTPDGRLLPASGQPPEFGYNAVRVPLHLCWSVRFDAAGTMLRRAILDRMLGFWSEQKPMPDRWDVERDTAAGGPAPKGFTDIAALVASSCRPTGTDAVAIPKEESYYSAALMTLVALARADLQQTGQP